MKKVVVWGGVLLTGLFWSGMSADMMPVSAAVQSVQEQTSAVLHPEVSYRTIAGMVLSGDGDDGRKSMTVHVDGSFEGSYMYHEKYASSGKVSSRNCQATFRGHFGQMEKVNAYTYMLPLHKTVCWYDDASEHDKGSTSHRARRFYDFDNTKRLYLYLPGTPMEYLPAFYRGEKNERQNKVLESYVLLNPLMQCAWASEKVPQNQQISRYDEWKRADWQREIAFYEEEQQELQATVDSTYASQMLLNISSFRVYDMWDIELARLCQALKKEMSAEKFAAFAKEQVKWQRRREKAMEKEGQKWSGGTGEGMARASVGIEITKQRVYKLLDLLQ